KQANARPHRRHDLEAAILNLQLGPLADRVHAAIDRHLAELPPTDQQTKYDQIWRLALRRMDLRHYIVGETVPHTSSPVQGEEGNEAARNQVVLNLNIPDPDLQELTSESATNFQAMNARLGLEMWGLKVFRGEDAASYDPAQWRARLDQARAV